MIAYIEDRLPIAAQAVPLARHALAVSLLPDVPDAVLDTILLLTTETVSRAVSATDEPWRLRVDIDDDVVRVSVRYRARSGVVDGDELRDVILDALSTSWGTDVSGDDTTLWFQVG